MERRRRDGGEWGNGNDGEKGIVRGEQSHTLLPGCNSAEIFPLAQNLLQFIQIQEP